MASLRLFRLVALAEGVSFVVLLFIAMPLKYLGGLPLAVRIAGSLHGLLFIAFVLALIQVSIARGWPVGRALLAFLSSIVPFATFVFDRSLRREIAAEAASSSVSRV